MRHRPTLTSPRTSSTRQLKSVASLELNSYKIDTSSLSEKAKEIEQLKTELETQISQYKASENMFHDEIDKLSEENKELRAKVKKLQTELNKVKNGPSEIVTSPRSHPPKHNISSSQPAPSNEIKLLNIKIASLQDELAKVKTQLSKKLECIKELQDYKKMYDIEVENKNNIMNFYENKLTLFQKDKITLISKYEEKISQLGSGLEANGTMIQMYQQNNGDKNNSLSMLPNGVKQQSLLSKQKEKQKEKQRAIRPYVSQKDVGLAPTTPKYVTQSSYSPKPPPSSSKNIKFIRPSKQQQPSLAQQSERQSFEEDSGQFADVQTPYKLLKASNAQEERNLENNSPYSGYRGGVNDMSVSSSERGKHEDMMLVSRGKAKKNGQEKFLRSSNTNEKTLTTQSNKTLKSDTQFIDMIRSIFTNLRNHSIKSESIKNFTSIRRFLTLPNPSPSQVINLLQAFPFGPLSTSQSCLQSSIQKMRKHLWKKYEGWSGSLLVELLIDKIEDMEIAYEVNSEDQAEIMAGLSGSEDDGEEEE